MLFYGLFCSEKLLFHKPYCILNTWKCIILAYALRCFLFFQRSFISWVNRTLCTHKIINSCVWLILLFFFFNPLWSFITQHLNRPFNLLLLFGLLKLLNKVLRLTNFSFILINFILLIINLLIFIFLVLKPFLFLLLFVSNHFCEVSKW